LLLGVLLLKAPVEGMVVVKVWTGEAWQKRLVVGKAQHGQGLVGARQGMVEAGLGLTVTPKSKV
jgi:hypothetical protein